MNTATRQRIVVGVDGSAGSRTALAWAVWQAELTGAGLEAVCVGQDLTMFSHGLGDVPPPHAGEDLAAVGQKTLDRSIEAVTAGRGHPFEVTTRVETGRAAEILPKLAGGALMLVVGSRGHGAFAGMLLGSVSQHCIQHSSCPVVVVPLSEAAVSA